VEAEAEGAEEAGEGQQRVRPRVQYAIEGGLRPAATFDGVVGGRGGEPLAF
jgi:hypothetical protein